MKEPPGWAAFRLRRQASPPGAGSELMALAGGLVNGSEQSAALSPSQLGVMPRHESSSPIHEFHQHFFVVAAADGYPAASYVVIVHDTVLVF